MAGTQPPPQWFRQEGDMYVFSLNEREGLPVKDFIKLAESFGAKGYEIGAASELAPTLEKALADEAVSIIACPVDYRENARLIERLGALTESI